MKPNELTRQVMVGDVPVGGGAPCAVQSMLNAPADDVEANLAQIAGLAEAGCEIIRMAIPHRKYLDAFEQVCAQSPLPVVADIHFDHVIAIEAARRGEAAHQPWEHRQLGAYRCCHRGCSRGGYSHPHRRERRVA